MYGRVCKKAAGTHPCKNRKGGHPWGEGRSYFAASWTLQRSAAWRRAVFMWLAMLGWSAPGFRNSRAAMVVKVVVVWGWRSNARQTRCLLKLIGVAVVKRT